jgi:hypothetical protein
MTTPTTNRRGALAAIAKAAVASTALGAACSISQCTTKANAATIDRTAWDRAFAVRQKAKRDYDLQDARWERIDHAYNRLCNKAAGRVEWGKLNDTSIAFSQAERERILERADLNQMERVYLDGENHWWWARDAEQKKANFREAIGQIKSYRRICETANERLGYDRTSELLDDLGDALSDADGKLMRLPSPDGPALLWKLELVNEVSDGSTAGWSADYIEQMMLDARRLLSGRA